jgi:hypothetical protein
MRMILMVAVVLLVVMPAGLNLAANCHPKSACKADCEKTKREILRIQARMRQGYGVSEGARMEAKLRELRKLRSKYC